MIGAMIPRKKSIIPDSKKGYIVHPVGPWPTSTIFGLAQIGSLETALETNFFFSRLRLTYQSNFRVLMLYAPPRVLSGNNLI